MSDDVYRAYRVIGRAIVRSQPLSNAPIVRRLHHGAAVRGRLHPQTGEAIVRWVQLEDGGYVLAAALDAAEA